MSNEELASWSTNERIDAWFASMEKALECLDSKAFDRCLNYHRTAGNSAVTSQFARIAVNGHAVRRAIACRDMNRDGFMVPPALLDEARTMAAVCDRATPQLADFQTHVGTSAIVQIIEVMANTPQLHAVLPSLELRDLIARSVGASLNEKITNHIGAQFEARSKEMSDGLKYSAEMLQKAHQLSDELKKTEQAVHANAETAQEAAKVARAALGNAAANAHSRRHKVLAAGEFARAKTAVTRASVVVGLIALVALVGAKTVDPFNSALTGVAAIAELIRVYGARLVVLSVLLYALSVFVRNYRAHTHNALVHDHRAAVFETFAAFSKAATDDAGRNLVLTQTLQLVLAQQPTGFLPTEPEPTPVSQAVELLEKISKLKGGKDG